MRAAASDSLASHGRKVVLAPSASARVTPPVRHVAGASRVVVKLTLAAHSAPMSGSASWSAQLPHGVVSSRRQTTSSAVARTMVASTPL